MADSPEGLSRQLRSGPSIHRCSVRFINNTGKDTDAVWISHKGTGIQYCRLLPGQHIQVITFVGHPWIFKDAQTGERMHVNHEDIYYPQQDNLPQGNPRQQKCFITLPLYSLQHICLSYISQLVKRDNISQLQLPSIIKDELLRSVEDETPTQSDYITLLQQQILDPMVQQQQLLQQQGWQLLQMLQPLHVLLQQQQASFQQLLGNQVINNLLQQHPLIQQLQRLDQLQLHAQHQLRHLMRNSLHPAAQNVPALVPAPQLGTQRSLPATQNVHPITQHSPPTTQNEHPTTQNRHTITQNRHPTTQNGHPTTQNVQPITQQSSPTTQNREPTTVQTAHNTEHTAHNRE